MREDLLGYLLGALEPEEMQRVGRAVRDNPALAAELDRLQAALRPLEEADELFEPPSGLVSRTLDAIDRYDAEHPSGGLTGGGMAGGPNATDPNRRRGESERLTPASVAPGSGALTAAPWRCVDCLTTAVAAMLLAFLVLPSVLRGRSLARRDGCENSLRELGTALTHYALLSQDRRLPQVAATGPLAFAGNYAPELRSRSLLSQETPYRCPSRVVPEPWMGQSIPTTAELLEADPIRLVRYHQVTGGDYAYTFGVREGGRYVAPRYQGREFFAILADVPLEAFTGWAAAHEGQGVNMLFEGGRIRFLVHGAMDALSDHPYRNHRGAVEAGVDPHDATLAPSWYSPF